MTGVTMTTEQHCADRADARRDRIADTVRRLGTQLREDRRERGPHVADAAWVDEPFDDWLAMLHEGKPLARTSMLALAVGMDQTLAVRDALIVSIVGGADGARKAVLMDFASRPHAPEVCARMGRLLTAAFTDEHGGLDEARCRAAVGALKAVLMDFASRPHAPEVCARMGRLLTAAFTDEHGGLDEARCRAAVGALREMAGIVPERYRVQPLTIMAYVLWWLGKDEAVEYALEALAIDERCSLAAIVLGAMRRYRVQPLTIMAYVLWWLGKDEAVEYALEALAIDERCSLAAIVLGAMRRGIYPVWLR